MANPAAAIIREVRGRPVVLVGLAAGGFAAFTLYRSRGQSTAADAAAAAADAAAAAAADPNAVDPNAAPTSPFDTGGGLGLPPSYDPTGGGYTDPTGGTPPQLTPDGCYLPAPAVPASLTGQGSWACASGVWVWNWAPPDTSPGGCPLPVPTRDPLLTGAGAYVCNTTTHRWAWVPTPKPPPVTKHGCPLPKPVPSAAQRARGGSYECNPNTHRWEWVPLGKKPPTATHTPAHGEETVRATTFHSWARRNGAGPALDSRAFTHRGANVIFTTGPKSAAKLPDGSTGELVQVRTSPGHTGLAGRWIKPLNWRWVAAT